MGSVPKPERVVLEHYREWLRWHPCAGHWPMVKPGDPGQLSQRRVQSEAAHVKSRGSGGDDERNMIPLCHVCHIDAQHLRGWNELWAKYPTTGLERAQYLAERYWEAYQAWMRRYPQEVAAW
jgi:hypothetical protein